MNGIRIRRIVYLLGLFTFFLAVLASIMVLQDKGARGVHRLSFLTQMFTKTPRILCAVHTHPGNHEKYAIHVKNTWGKRCTILLFITTKRSGSLPTLVVNVRDAYNNMWTKSAAAYPLIYQQYFDKADWFFKCDDDAYVIMENLHHLVRRHSTKDPIYLSFHYNWATREGHPHGGSGYILSREALRRLATRGLAGNSSLCVKTGFFEDVEAGKCLSALNVTLVDTRDQKQRHTFLPTRPQIIAAPEELSGNLPRKDADTLKSFKRHAKYPLKHGPDCCSDRAVSFHYVSPQDMYVFEYFLYGLRR